MTKDVEREKRLAEALRENLKRRKAQARDASNAAVAGTQIETGNEADELDS